jgi:hypothetical protein
MSARLANPAQAYAAPRFSAMRILGAAMLTRQGLDGNQVSMTASARHRPRCFGVTSGLLLMERVIDKN